MRLVAAEDLVYEMIQAGVSDGGKERLALDVLVVGEAQKEAGGLVHGEHVEIGIDGDEPLAHAPEEGLPLAFLELQFADLALQIGGHVVEGSADPDNVPDVAGDGAGGEFALSEAAESAGQRSE